MEHGQNPEKVVAIVVAAGSGSRMGSSSPVKKQFRSVAGRTLLEWSVGAFCLCDDVDEVVVVTGKEEIGYVKTLLHAPEFEKVTAVVSGGATRQESVRLGLEAVDAAARWVIVHDGVRPLVTETLIAEVLQGARTFGAATLGVPLSDTIKEVDPDRNVVATVDRSKLWAIQTPQAFERKVLEEAHRRFQGATDDAGLVEQMGRTVHVVLGTPRNIKVTTEADMDLVRYFLAEREGGAVEPSPLQEEVATGFGFDVHRLVEGRPLILGGVRLEFDRGLAGHSDADVLAHAVADALLGAAALGDIGTHFPDTDPQYKGADSLELLRKVAQKLEATGCSILHVDAFISAEAPRLKGSIPRMRELLADAMGVEVGRISIKAGTGEGAGPVGRGEVIEARAVATIRRPLLS